MEKKPKSLNSEIERIREAYQRRRNELAPDIYHSPGNVFIYQDRKSDVRNLMIRNGIVSVAGKRILEIGCGSGTWLQDLKLWGAREDQLHGIDLDEERVLTAKEKLPAADLRAGNAANLPWPGDHFDLVLQSTVFTSVLDDKLKNAMAAAMLRVLKKDGVILWYDFRFNNPFNRHVKGVGDAEIKRLFPARRVNLYRATLAPPLARVLAPFSEPLCRFLKRVPFLKTHTVAFIWK